MQVLIIDGLNFVRRIFSAVPDHTRAGNPAPTEHAQAVINAVNAAATRAINHHQVSHAVMVFEPGGDTWRHQAFNNYKADRKPQPTELIELLPKLKATLDQRHLTSLQAEGFEADDTIASISSRLAEKSIDCTILSSDHLLCQLLETHISVFDHFQNKTLDRFFIRERYGIEPAQLADFFALAGQSSVSIPGISGIGLKTAAELLQAHVDIQAVMQNIDELKSTLSKKLTGQAEALELFKKLFSLRRDVKIDANLNQWRLQQT